MKFATVRLRRHIAQEVTIEVAYPDDVDIAKLDADQINALGARPDKDAWEEVYVVRRSVEVTGTGASQDDPQAEIRPDGTIGPWRNLPIEPSADQWTEQEGRRWACDGFMLVREDGPRPATFTRWLSPQPEALARALEGSKGPLTPLSFARQESACRVYFRKDASAGGISVHALRTEHADMANELGLYMAVDATPADLIYAFRWHEAGSELVAVFAQWRLE